MRLAGLKSSIVVSFFLLIAAYTAAGKVIYVDSDAQGPVYDGSSWITAFEYLQEALTGASNGDEIRVAQGLYKPHEPVPPDFPPPPPDRTATFQLKNGVVIKGGFAGFGEPAPDARDIELYETILSGDLTGNDIDVNDPCDLLTEPTRLENSYHVVTNSNVDETAVLDGFTITAGNANGLQEDELDRGGGMFNNGHDNLCNPTVTGCTFFGNSAAESGGGMFNYEHGDGECRPILTNCAFIRNAGGSEGGGMSSWGGHSVVTNCTFGDNYSNFCGDGMANAGSNLTVNNCTFSGNSNNGEGGGMWNYSSNPTLTNCILWGNTDGGPTDESAQIYNFISSTPVINYCCVQGWTGDLGGLGNIGSNPFFAEPDNGDYHLKSEAGRWDANGESWEQDAVTSPCIDAGDIKSPIGLEPFPNGGVINMGAYGGTAEASKSYFGEPVCETIVAGDINGDCRIDFKDFAFMAFHWLQDNSP